MDKKAIGLYFLVLPFLFTAKVVFAQESATQKELSQETAPNEAPNIKDGEIRLLLDKIEIIGELEKPQAVFIIPGTNPEIDDIRIQRSFFNNIFRTVERKGRVISKIQTQPIDDRKDYIPW